MTTTTTTDTKLEIPAGTYAVDPSHSSASFEVEHGGLSVFRGRFHPIDGKLIAADDGLTLEGAVNVASISIDDEQIRPHLLSPEFFDADRNPDVTFRSTSIEGGADDLRVAGELALAGASQEVEATGKLRGPVEFAPGMEKLSLSLETVIDRTQFGMNWQMELPGGEQALANEVRLIVELELLRS